MNAHSWLDTTAPSIDRRTFVSAAAGALPCLLGTPLLVSADEPPPAEGLIERVRDPQNLEFPFHTLNAAIVPNDRFFVRNHFAAPRLDAQAWRLRVEGAVERELQLT